MRPGNKFIGKPVMKDVIRHENRLLLYDKYGPMAYGVIMQIIPQPTLAQRVLVDVFASPQLLSLAESSTQTACAIVRIARSKALELKPTKTSDLANVECPYGMNDNLPKLIFDLSFNKGFTLKAVAERLEMTYLDVVQAIRAYVKSIHTH